MGQDFMMQVKDVDSLESALKLKFGSTELLGFFPEKFEELREHERTGEDYVIGTGYTGRNLTSSFDLNLQTSILELMDPNTKVENYRYAKNVSNVGELLKYLSKPEVDQRFIGHPFDLVFTAHLNNMEREATLAIERKKEELTKRELLLNKLYKESKNLSLDDVSRYDSKLFSDCRVYYDGTNAKVGNDPFEFHIKPKQAELLSKIKNNFWSQPEGKDELKLMHNLPKELVHRFEKFANRSYVPTLGAVRALYDLEK